MTDSGDLVATWNILIADGKHKIEFEHGTTSGKRIIRVDGKVKNKINIIYQQNNIRKFRKIIDLKNNKLQFLISNVFIYIIYFI